MHITTIGLDLAKNIFQLCGVTADGSVAFNRPIRRAGLLKFFAKQPPCLVGMEACSSSHYWAREFTKLGHDVRLIAPIYVKPYVKPRAPAHRGFDIWSHVTRASCYLPDRFSSATLRFVEVTTSSEVYASQSA